MHTQSADRCSVTVFLSALSALTADIPAPVFNLPPSKVLALPQVLIPPAPVKVSHKAGQRLPTHWSGVAGLCRYDAPAHLVEEVESADVTVPYSVVSSIALLSC